jgi:hypothetical protein
MMSLLALGAQGVGDAAAKAGLTLVESSILGAVAVLCAFAAGFAIWKLNKTQDLRVQDQKDMSGRMEDLVKQMTSAFSKMTNSIDNLTSTDREGQKVLQGVKQSLDGVILEAVKGRGTRR